MFAHNFVTRGPILMILSLLYRICSAIGTMMNVFLTDFQTEEVVDSTRIYFWYVCPRTTPQHMDRSG